MYYIRYAAGVWYAAQNAELMLQLIICSTGLACPVNLTSFRIKTELASALPKTAHKIHAPPFEDQQCRLHVIFFQPMCDGRKGSAICSYLCLLIVMLLIRLKKKTHPAPPKPTAAGTAKSLQCEIFISSVCASELTLCRCVQANMQGFAIRSMFCIFQTCYASQKHIMARRISAANDNWAARVHKYSFTQVLPDNRHMLRLFGCSASAGRSTCALKQAYKLHQYC